MYLAILIGLSNVRGSTEVVNVVVGLVAESVGQRQKLKTAN